LFGFTVNTDILIIASGKSDKGDRAPALRGSCVALLNWMVETAGAKLVLDTEKLIQQEYSDKLGDDEFGNRFITTMITSDKIEQVQRIDGKRWKVIQSKVKLHKKDQTIARASMASQHKLLVAEESHFAAAASLLWKHARIEVLAARGAVARTKAS